MESIDLISIIRIAGIGGLAIGVFLLLFREVIRTNIFPKLTKSQAYRLLLIIVILIWSVAIIGIIASVYLSKSDSREDPKKKTIVLMDSTLQAQVYDDDSKVKGRTNADDINDILDDIDSLQIYKEATSVEWTREETIRVMDPDLIIIHHSCFIGGTEHHGYEKRFRNFLEYMRNTKTFFLIYSRSELFNGGFGEAIIDVLEDKIPELEGRLFLFNFRGEKNFKDILVAQDLKNQVKKILNLD